MKTDIIESLHRRIDLKDDITAPSAVTSVRASFGDKLLPSEAETSGAACAAPDVNLRAIYKHVRRLSGFNVNDTSSPACGEADDPVDKGENGIIFTEADIPAGKILRATLTDDDISGENILAAVTFDPEPL